MSGSRRLSRRGFLATVAAGGAGAAAMTGCGARSRPSEEVAPALRAEREVPSFCELCFWNCGLIAETRGNRVIRLKGHPLSPTARGRLCARGNAGAAFLRDGDRLKYPMVRVGARGEGRFRRVGWPEAYRRIREGFEAIKATHGAQALALLYHGSGGPLLRTLLAAYGSPNFAGPSYAQCRGPRNVGFALTFGERMPSPEPLDFARTQCMVFFGSHLGENAHNSQVQDFLRAKARGARLVVLDPRFSTAAQKADLWLPIRPGADLAVILAWIHLLLKESAEHRDFVTQQCTGLEELRRHVANLSPAWAAREAEVPEADIVRAYGYLKAAMPAVILHPGRHATWYGAQDTQRARGQAILAALLGAWWAPGSFCRPERAPLRDFPLPPFPELPPDVDKAAGRFPFAQEVTTNGIRDATRTGRPYPIRGWFVHGTNVLQALPGRAETEDALRSLDFLVVCDVQPTEITRWADVLLPEDLYLERYDDLQAGAAATPYIALRQPVVRSPHDTRPAWRIARDLARELGLEAYFPFTTFEEYLEARLEGSGTTLAQLQREGIVQAPRRTPHYLDPATPHSWATPSGKVELYSPRMAAAGFDPLPTYRPQPRPPAGSFRLLYGRSPLHTFGRTQNNPLLHDMDPTNVLWMSPAAARALGLAHGDPVEVRNARGGRSGALVLKVTERMPDDAVYMVHGFGHRAPGLRLAHGRGGDDSAVIDDYVVDPISGGTGMRTQIVTVERARP